MKICSACKTYRAKSEFYKDSQKSDGLSSICKACSKSRAADYYKKNKEKILSRNMRWQDENPEKKLAIARRRRSEKPEAVREYYRQWREKNREKAASYTAAWREKVGVDRINDDAKSYREANRKKVREASLRWQRENPGKANASNAARYAAKLRATPKWADMDAIERIYIEAEILYKETGIKYDVDHVVPLRSKLVCGLHWHKNLVVLPATENRRKGNRYWPDMP